MNEEEKNMNNDGSPAPEPAPAPAPAPAPSFDSNQTVDAKTSKLNNFTGWSWGGFILHPFLLLGSRQYKYMLLYLLLFIFPITALYIVFSYGPFYIPPALERLLSILSVLHLGIILGLMIFFGLKGRKITSLGKTFKNDDEVRGFIKGLDHAGFVIFIIFITLIILQIVFAGAMSLIVLGTMGSLR